VRRVIVAFSGGADSAYLAWAASRVLSVNAIAITADSASLPESHKRDAEAFAARFGIAHEYIQTREFDDPDYLRNDPDRCFYCKDELLTRLEQAGCERGFEHIIYGHCQGGLPSRRIAALRQDPRGGKLGRPVVDFQRARQGVHRLGCGVVAQRPHHRGGRVSFELGQRLDQFGERLGTVLSCTEDER